MSSRRNYMFESGWQYANRISRHCFHRCMLKECSIFVPNVVRVLFSSTSMLLLWLCARSFVLFLLILFFLCEFYSFLRSISMFRTRFSLYGCVCVCKLPPSSDGHETKKKTANFSITVHTICKLFHCTSSRNDRNFSATNHYIVKYINNIKRIFVSFAEVTLCTCIAKQFRTHLYLWQYFVALSFFLLFSLTLSPPPSLFLYLCLVLSIVCSSPSFFFLLSLFAFTIAACCYGRCCCFCCCHHSLRPSSFPE